MLRIVRITEVLDSGNFIAEDVFNGDLVSIRLSAKKRMHFDKDVLVVDDECVAQFSPYEPDRGYVVTPTDFKMDSHNDNGLARAELETR